MRLMRSPRLMVSLLLTAALVAGVVASERSARAMADAATRFVASLTPDERAQATFGFDSEERTHWHFIPTEVFARHGLLVKQMTEAQRKHAHDLLKAGLSQRGYLTATAIMELETVLGGLEGAQRASGRGAESMVRDPGKYFFSVFGTPSSRGNWGWRVEGHHVSLNFTVVNGTLTASTPSFFGSNPAEVREGPKKGLRILASEEDTARTLLMALDQAQRARAIITSVALNDIVTTNKVEVSALSPTGITADAFNAQQRELLMKVLDAYAGAMASDIATERIERIKKAGIEKIAFAWAGDAERGKKHYYRVQGPTFLIEYDNTQNDGNHIHSVWRDFAGDFGRDLLREHVKAGGH